MISIEVFNVNNFTISQSAELIKEPTPLKAIDFCYHDEDEMVTVLDCITLCVMVVSYSAENSRGYQMLVSQSHNQYSIIFVPKKNTIFK